MEPAVGAVGDREGLPTPRRLDPCGRTRLRRRDQAAPATMRTIEQVLDLDAMRDEIADLGRAGRRAEPVGRPGTPPGDRDGSPCCRARSSAFAELAGRIDDLGDHGRARPGGGRRRDADRGRVRAGHGSARPSRPSRCAPCCTAEYDDHDALVTIRSGAGGVRRGRLRRDADADVHALGRAAQLPGRGVRHLLRRGGRPQVGDLRDPRALRLRHPLGRGRHPPAGADQPVRQPGPPPDVVRRGRGRARARADRRDRDPRRGHPHRRLPLRAAPAASR